MGLSESISKHFNDESDKKYLHLADKKKLPVGAKGSSSCESSDDISKNNDDVLPCESSRSASSSLDDLSKSTSRSESKRCCKLNEAQLLGHGVQGNVYSCSDPNLVVKQCKCFDYSISPILRELEALYACRDLPGVVQFKSWNVSSTPEDEHETVSIYLEKHTCDLREYYQKKVFTRKEIIGMFADILEGLANIHAAGYIHRDLKPDNILYKDQKLVICDLGMSRRLDFELDVKMLSDKNVQTIWYRAPEVLLKEQYGRPIDVWSAGLCFAEIINGNAVACGKDSTQMSKYTIFKPKFFKKNVKSWFKKNKTELRYSKTFFHFIKACLAFDPSKRWTAEQLLKHPFLEGTRRVVKRKIVPYGGAAPHNGTAPSNMTALHKEIQHVFPEKKEYNWLAYKIFNSCNSQFIGQSCCRGYKFNKVSKEGHLLFHACMTAQELLEGFTHDFTFDNEVLTILFPNN